MLALACSSALADYELEARATNLDYYIGRYAKFNVNLYQIGVSKFYGDSGWSVMVGESNQGIDDAITGEVKNFWVMSAVQRFNLSNRLATGIRFNYTEYKSTINGRGNPDTGLGYGLSLIARVSRDYSIKVSYDDYYRKTKESLGKEKTNGTGVSVMYRF